MKSTSAVLRTAKLPRPYTSSMPITFEDLELEEPRPGEVRVRIEAAGLCHSDLSVVNGDRVRPLPLALGHEAAGVIDGIGAGVTDLAIGDHVVLVYVPSCEQCDFCVSGQPALCERGAASNSAGELLTGGRRLRTKGAGVNHHLGVSAFAEYAVVHHSSTVKVDDDVPFEVAALLGCAMATGYGAVVRTAGVRSGDSVIIIGLGGVGLSAVIAAHAVGASEVVVVDPVPSKRQRALELGGTLAATPDEVESVLGEKGCTGADWVFEAVGSGSAMERAFRLTKRGGTTVLVGLPHPDVALSLPALAMVAESRTVKGCYMGSTRPQDDIPQMVQLWRERKLPVERLISADRPLIELNEAFEALADGSAIRQIIRPQSRRDS